MALGALPPPKQVQHPDQTGLRSEIIRTIRDFATNAPRSLQRAIGPSQVGTPCARQLAFLMSPDIERGRDMHDPWPSIIGTATHAWLADAFTHANNVARQQGLPPPWHLERRVDVGFGLRGSCDCFHEPTGTVLDWKVLGETQYRKYTTEGPSETYETQADCYGLGYLRAGYRVSRVGIGFFGRSKRLSDLHIWSKPFDLDNALRALKRMRQVQELVQHNVHPMRIPATPGGACYFCEFRGDETQGLCPGRESS